MTDERKQKDDVIIGRNPVSEAIQSSRTIDKVLVARGAKNGAIVGILARAKKKGIPIKEVDAKKLDYLSGGANHQGIAAFTAVKEYAEVEDIFALAEERNEKPFIIVLDNRNAHGFCSFRFSSLWGLFFCFHCILTNSPGQSYNINKHIK